ncbi:MULTISPECIES: hypothetical protein [Cupriavidus]|uniref:hypothetical protein n=1 Tax=Cupriavidus TaxID=106589 RepID=UPI000039E73E|nr:MULTISPECIES: hypothetical protein [Cupriavidus]QYY29973.1 hypothetical protein K2O51_01090 [Cupriavidus pinatubonensis]TPQ37511.1 hypothetical protein C2U69_16200 [Cupriavidus pinatubonensis]
MKTFHVRRPARLRHASRPAFALALAGAALALALGIAAPAHADKDADRARAAVQSGEILPLSRILEAVSQRTSTFPC